MGRPRRMVEDRDPNAIIDVDPDVEGIVPHRYLPSGNHLLRNNGNGGPRNPETLNRNTRVNDQPRVT
jgi:hypothetical protein